MATNKQKPNRPGSMNLDKLKRFAVAEKTFEHGSSDNFLATLRSGEEPTIGGQSPSAPSTGSEGNAPVSYAPSAGTPVSEQPAHSSSPPVPVEPQLSVSTIAAEPSTHADAQPANLSVEPAVAAPAVVPTPVSVPAPTPTLVAAAAPAAATVQAPAPAVPTPAVVVAPPVVTQPATPPVVQPVAAPVAPPVAQTQAPVPAPSASAPVEATMHAAKRALIDMDFGIYHDDAEPYDTAHVEMDIPLRPGGSRVQRGPDLGMDARRSQKSTLDEGKSVRTESLSVSMNDSLDVDRMRALLAANGLSMNRSEIFRLGVAVLKEVPIETLVKLTPLVHSLTLGRRKK